MRKHRRDTKAIDTIAEIMSEPQDWSADTLDAIAEVLDAVRPKDHDEEGRSAWKHGVPLVWLGGRYQ